MAPRISLDGLCTVVTDRDVRHASMVDLSSTGIRIERPFDPATGIDAIQLEIELPGIDEILWACGHVMFAHVSVMGGFGSHAQPRLWCQEGIQIDEAAGRDRRLLRDYVIQTHRTRLAAIRPTLD
jgi:hypothetical protein